ncbi:Elongation factor P hydroxylase [Thalassocella blandensis]|nr:Elongation factor P hydroxylase [Thalassocella blandensis]
MQKDSTFFQCGRLERLQGIFSTLFWREYRTRLEGGQSEPFYRAENDQYEYNVIFFTQDYFSSALHEIAHWCVAGQDRRKLDDYGYWYEPDGRSSAQQALFEQVEVVPQSMERIFAQAAGQPFRVSADNLDGDCKASEQFIRSIHAQTLYYCHHGLPPRADAFAKALAKAFEQPDPYDENLYTLEQLC